jgi:exopolysaccharide biosynthesis polyprenyl glycosylphosphotransferase
MVADRIAPSLMRSGLQASEHRALLLAGDILVAGCAVVAALWFWTLTAGIDFPTALRTRVYWFLAAPLWVAGLTATYPKRISLSARRTASGLLKLAGLLLLAYVALYFYAPRHSLPRLLALYFLWEAALLTLAWRLVYIYVFTQTGLRRRVVIAGAGPSGQRILDVMRTSAVRDSVVVGFVDGDLAKGRPEGTSADSGDPPVLGPFGQLSRLVAEHQASEVILAVPDASPALVEQLVTCQEAGVDVVRMATVYEQALQRLPIEHLEPNWLFNSYADAVRAKDSSRLAKRLVDLAGGLVGSLLFLLATPFISAAIWLETGRPIFYRQTRAGRAGRTFQILKFRTMVPGAEAEGQPRWAERRDPRITRVGRFLRRTRLDELPNLLSVLRGDMSLVGPRPERPEFVADLERRIPFYRARHIVRPGLTGWAQINYPYGDSVEDAVVKLEYDLYYMKHRSLLFDLWIIARTVPAVVGFRGR